MKYFKNWREWLKDRQEAIRVDTKETSLWKISDWETIKEFFGRLDGMFFSVRGFSITLYRNGKKLFSWAQPLLKPEEPIHGWVILAVADEEDARYLLLNVKPEPGWKEVHLAPTFQASKSKLDKFPDYPRREVADMAESQTVWQDGGVHFDKRNVVGVSYFSSRKDFVKRVGELSEDERWFTEQEYFEALKASEVSDHLLQTMGCLKPKK